jgi:hypothetical protein
MVVTASIQPRMNSGRASAGFRCANVNAAELSATCKDARTWCRSSLGHGAYIIYGSVIGWSQPAVKFDILPPIVLLPLLVLSQSKTHRCSCRKPLCQRWKQEAAVYKLLQRWRKQDTSCSCSCGPQVGGAAKDASRFCLGDVAGL